MRFRGWPWAALRLAGNVTRHPRSRHSPGVRDIGSSFQKIRELGPDARIDDWNGGGGRQIMRTDAPRSRVLLVEDEFLLCDMLSEVLADHGFEVYAVANASEALRHLTCGSPCDILLTDINLP